MSCAVLGPAGTKLKKKRDTGNVYPAGRPFVLLPYLSARMEYKEGATRRYERRRRRKKEKKKILHIS